MQFGKPTKQLNWLVITAIVFCLGCSNRMMETSLYFGQAKHDGSTITDKEWADFKEHYIIKVFKEGSSTSSVSGTWYDSVSHRIISEQTYVVTYYYEPSALKSKQIDSLRYWYKQIFQQQSVLRVDKKVKVEF